MNIQQTYEVLKGAIIKDVETKDKYHNHTFGAVLGIVMALESLSIVESIGEPLYVDGQ